MMRRENGRVRFDVSREVAERVCSLGYHAVIRDDGRAEFVFFPDAFTGFLMELGMAAGAAETLAERHEWLRVANAVNVGNPHFAPYAVDDPKAE